MIRQIEHNEIPFLGNREAKKLGIVFHKTYCYIGYFIDGELIGVVGFKEGEKTSYLGGAFIDEKHRGKGIYSELCEERVRLIKNPIIVANCTSNSIFYHLKRGAKIVKVYKNGIARIRYNQKNL